MGLKIDTHKAEFMGASLAKKQEGEYVLVQTLRIPDLFGISNVSLNIPLRQAIRLRDFLNKQLPASQFPPERNDI